jgi:hypothetical protein
VTRIAVLTLAIEGAHVKVLPKGDNQSFSPG